MTLNFWHIQWTAVNKINTLQTCFKATTEFSLYSIYKSTHALGLFLTSVALIFALQHFQNLTSYLEMCQQ
jgi:hypothetical protein